MKVTFEFSAGDLADVAERTAGRSRVVQGWRRGARITWAVLTGVLVYAFASGAPLNRAVFAALAAVALFIFMSMFRRPPGNRPRLLKYFREQLGGDGPFVCEVELLPSGLVTRQMGVEARHGWPQVASVTEVADGIEFVYRPMGTLLVRARAFPTAEARQEFLSLARQYASQPENADSAAKE